MRCDHRNAYGSRNPNRGKRHGKRAGMNEADRAQYLRDRRASRVTVYYREV